MRLLILGGTTEAALLARRVAGCDNLETVLSLAGRTRDPVAPPTPFRVGGFGGVEGLKAYLTQQRIDAVVDATHPFAAQMSRHAAVTCRDLGVPLVAFTRPPWRRQAGDRWVSAATMEAAVAELGEPARTVFLTVGGLQLAVFGQAPQHRYVVRTIEPPEMIRCLPSHRLILARGPFSVADEMALMRQEQVDALVTKNSGAAAVSAKITAARALGIEVVMVERPAPEAVAMLEDVDAVLAWIEAHRGAP